MKKILLLGVISILFLSFANCEKVNAPKTYNIKYKVAGSAKKVNITYQNDSGGTSQISNITPPWDYTFTANEGDFLYISAQNSTQSGDIKVYIYVNNSLYKSSISSGAYVIATASGEAGK